LELRMTEVVVQLKL